MWYKRQALALEKKGRNKEALEHYARAALINPRSADCHSNIGKGLLFLAHDPAGAMEEFRRALRIDSHHYEAWTYLGMCLTAEGRIEEGEACFLRALQIRPGYDLARRYLSGGDAAPGK
ncbi:tetratricopeptide repeat protein, partial [archaeon]|nr:tetratricopeptide repeat protein [archaeon]